MNESNGSLQAVRYKHDKHASISKLVLWISGALCGCSALVGFTVESFAAEPVMAESKAPGMNFQLLSEQNGRKVWVLAFHKGDEVLAGIAEFARNQHLTTAHFTAIGAFSNATLAWFDLSRKTFQTIPVPSEVEVVSLVGNITADQDNAPLVHIHCALGDRNGNLKGGHLLEALVSVTLEVFLTEEPGTVHKVMDEETGLKLIETNLKIPTPKTSNEPEHSQSRLSTPSILNKDVPSGPDLNSDVSVTLDERRHFDTNSATLEVLGTPNQAVDEFMKQTPKQATRFQFLGGDNPVDDWDSLGKVDPAPSKGWSLFSIHF